MKYLFSFVLVIFLFSACYKCKDKMVKDCFEIRLEEFKKESDAVTIDRYKLKNGDGYWYLLNKNASAWDGSDPFIDENCNKVCYTCGECNPPSCLNEIEFDKTIWKK